MKGKGIGVATLILFAVMTFSISHSRLYTSPESRHSSNVVLKSLNERKARRNEHDAARRQQYQQKTEAARRAASASALTQLVFEDQKKVFWLPQLNSSTGKIKTAATTTVGSSSTDGSAAPIAWRPNPQLTQRGALTDATGHTFGWSILSTTTPRIIKVKGLLTPEECDNIMNLANGKIAPNEVINLSGKKSSFKQVSSVRSSSGTFLTGKLWDTPGNMALRRRVQLLAGLMQDRWIEATQILRYLEGQQYVTHPDYFSESDSTNINRGGQRIASLIVQLNECPEGGGTSFPMAAVNGSTASTTAKGANNRDEQQQQHGLVVKSNRGDATLFYNTDENFHVDSHSFHGGLPPGKNSTKWVAVVWLHPRPHY